MHSIGVALALLILAAGAWAQGDYPGIAARVNGAEISNDRLYHSYEEYLRENHVNIVMARSPERLDRLLRETLDLLIEQELAWQAAQKKGMVASPPEVDKAVAAVRAAFNTPDGFARRLANEGYTEASYREHMRRLVSAQKYLDGVRAAAATVTDAELERFYHDNTRRLTLPEQVRARHILIKLAPTATDEDRKAARARLIELLAQVRSGTDFAALAREHSEDESAAEGGDLGLFARGEMLKPLEQAAFALKPGEVSEVIETPLGLHILRLEEHHEPRLLPLDEIREKLRDYLREERAKEAVSREIQRLRKEATIEVLARF